MAALDIMHTTPPPAEWVRVGDLQPWDRNPKAHPAETVAEIARSIVRFGFTEPLIVWRSQKRVVAGHGRLLAAQMLYREDPGRKLATDQPGDAPEAAEDGLVPVRWMEFANEREAAAYAVADNRLTEKNQMDPGLVAEIFADLEQNGVSLDGLGYADVELQSMLDTGGFSDAEAGLVEEVEGSEGGGEGEGEGEEPEEVYTSKIKLPLYEPKGKKPAISELYDDSKTRSLLEEIDDSDAPEDIKGFLRIAAQRHTSIHFRNVAEFYCHASPEVQGLMERSALVIIDFGKAIEGGFVRLTDRLAAIAGREQEAANEG